MTPYELVAAEAAKHEAVAAALRGVLERLDVAAEIAAFQSGNLVPPHLVADPDDDPDFDPGPEAPRAGPSVARRTAAPVAVADDPAGDDDEDEDYDPRGGRVFVGRQMTFARKLAAALAGGPRTLPELAKDLHTPAWRLGRQITRITAVCDWFAEGPTGWRLTAAGAAKFASLPRPEPEGDDDADDE